MQFKRHAEFRALWFNNKAELQNGKFMLKQCRRFLSNLESQYSNSPKLATFRESHAIHFSHSAATFKETPYVILGRIIWDASHIELLSLTAIQRRRNIKSPSQSLPKKTKLQAQCVRKLSKHQY